MTSKFTEHALTLVETEWQLDQTTYHWHQHEHGQFVFAQSGIFLVRTTLGSWIVMPGKAVWIPANTLHETKAVGTAVITVANFVGRSAPQMPATCTVVTCTSFLRAAINELSECAQQEHGAGKDTDLINVIIDRIEKAPRTDFHLPLPKEPRIRRIAELVLSNPTSKKTIDEWSAETGASSRTVARLFKNELGVPFGSWRRQVIMHHALVSLASGASVSQVAYELGFCNQAAFSVQFKKELGLTPSGYVNELKIAQGGK